MTSTESPYEDLEGLVTLMTGDEKHGPSATSTLDVIWVLYRHVLRVDPGRPDDPDRDRFLLSKGHGPMAYYAVLAAHGFISRDDLVTFGAFDSPLGYHPDRIRAPGVEISSGSLGHGLGLAVGTALGLRLAGRKAPQVVVLVGDAELDEGSNAEAIEYAGRIALDRLTATVIDNGSSSHGWPGGIEARFGLAGWTTVAVDGRDHRALREAFVTPHPDRPLAVVAQVEAEIVTATDLATSEDQRERFYRVVPELLAAHPNLALVLADIGVGYLDAQAVAPVAERVVNVGIREQLLISVAGGLALAGYRPIVHTFPPFLLERPFEQVKLDLGHQGVGAVLVSAGGSYGWAAGGETHFGHRDVALLDTLDGWTVHVPGHPDEAETLLRDAVAADGRVYLRLDNAANRAPLPLPRGSAMTVVRRGGRGTVVAVGPLRDRVLAATAGLDVTILYAATIRPFDTGTLRSTLTTPDVVLVEPYLAGTSAAAAADALADIPHRLLALGVGRRELRRYGTVADHDRAHGLDGAGLRSAISAFLDP